MTTSRHVLSFDLTAQTLTYKDDAFENAVEQSYLHIEAWPRIDGHQLIDGRSSYVFDITRVLGHGVETSELDIFTCSCGHAGCIGIHEEVKLEVDADEVRWVFPEDTFRGCVNTDLFAPGEALIVRFERSQYEAELADVEKRILGLANGTDLPAVLPPYSYPDLETPLQEELELSKAHTKRYLAQNRHRAEIFGALLDAEVSIVFPNGAQYWTSVPQISYAEANRIAESRDLMSDDDDEILEEEVLPRFHGQPAEILKALRSFEWMGFKHAVWYDTRIEQSTYLPNNQQECEAQWAGAQFKFKWTA